MHPFRGTALPAFIVLFVIAPFLTNPAFAWIPPAALEFGCAQGAGIDWPDFPMGGHLKASPEDCKKMIVAEARSDSLPENDDTICLPKDITDDELYQVLLKGYQDTPNKNITYMAVVKETLWKQFTCSESAKNRREQRLLEAQKGSLEGFVSSERNQSFGNPPKSVHCFPKNMSDHDIVNQMFERAHITTVQESEHVDWHCVLSRIYQCHVTSDKNEDPSLLEKWKSSATSNVAYERTIKTGEPPIPSFCPSTMMSDREILEQVYQKEGITSLEDAQRFDLACALKEYYPCK